MTDILVKVAVYILLCFQHLVNKDEYSKDSTDFLTGYYVRKCLVLIDSPILLP